MFPLRLRLDRSTGLPDHPSASHTLDQQAAQRKRQRAKRPKQGLRGMRGSGAAEHEGGAVTGAAAGALAAVVAGRPEPAGDPSVSSGARSGAYRRPRPSWLGHTRSIRPFHPRIHPRPLTIQLWSRTSRQSPRSARGAVGRSSSSSSLRLQRRRTDPSSSGSTPGPADRSSSRGYHRRGGCPRGCRRCGGTTGRWRSWRSTSTRRRRRTGCCCHEVMHRMNACLTTVCGQGHAYPSHPPTPSPITSDHTGALSLAARMLAVAAVVLALAFAPPPVGRGGGSRGKFSQ